MSDFPGGLATYRAADPLQSAFEAGKRYDIRLMVDGDENCLNRTVEWYSFPMLKLADIVPDKESKFFSGNERTVYGELINITSQNFVSAVLSQHNE